VQQAWASDWYSDELKQEQVRVEPYSGADDRIGWKATYIVLVDGRPTAFTDGPLS
jgi:hypothetical protein